MLPSIQFRRGMFSLTGPHEPPAKDPGSKSEPGARGTLQLSDIFSLSPKFLLSVLQEIEASPF
jgi:hypothetical protein